MDREPDPDQMPDGPEAPPPPDGALPDGPIPPPRRRRGLLIAAGMALLAVIGVGTWAFVALRGTEDVLVRMVPEDASVYVTAYLDPSAGQKLALRSMLEKFPQTEDSQQLNDAIDQAINDGLGDVGLESEDIRDWIGSQIGVAAWIDSAENPKIAFLAKSRDEDGANRTLGKIRAAAEAAGVTWEEEEHEGVAIAVDRSGILAQEQAYALFGDTVVFANSLDAVQRIIDTDQGVRASLETSEAFKDSTAPLAEDRLGMLFVDAGSLIEDFASAIPVAPGTPNPVPFGEGLIGVGASLSAHSDGMSAEFHVAIDGSKLTAEERDALGTAHENETLAYTPENAFGVMAFTGFDQISSQLSNFAGVDPTFDDLERELGITDIAQHLSGDVGLEVGPSDLGPVEGAILIGTDDAAAMQSFLDRLATFVLEELAGSGAIPPEGVVPTTEEYRGVTITSYQVPGLASLGLSPAYAVSDGMAILASFPQEVRDILDAKAEGEDIRSSTRYRRVISRLDESNITLQYVDIEAVVQAIRTALPPSEQQQFDAEVVENIGPLKGFGLTVLGTEDLISLRLFVLIE